LVGADGRLLDLSPGVGVHFAEAGRTDRFAGLFLDEDRAGVERALLSGVAARFEARARRPGGATGDFDLLFERRPDGRIAVLMIDRTAETRAADALAGEIGRAKAAAREEAAMLADLSHEMKTPLNAVIGFAETIERETFGPIGHANYRQYAEHIRMAGRHLLDLVSTVLDAARVEANQYELKRVKTDPAALARECAGLMGHGAASVGLKIETAIEDGLPQCWLDPRAVRQILINLLSNAVKFTSDGAISLSVRRDGDDILFTVKDDGVGMNAETLRRIGARFSSASGDGVRGERGTGLGLSLAIALAELHGGSVALASAPGEGLEASVRLPIETAPAVSRGVVRAVLCEAEEAFQTHAEAEAAPASELDRIASIRSRPARNAA
jgi:cell cycle sensor histidine kinase DivJ